MQPCLRTFLLSLLFASASPALLLAQAAGSPVPPTSLGPQASDVLQIFSSLPVFQARAYGASGSANTGLCSGIGGSNALSCSFATADFAPGQGIHIVGAGPAAATIAISAQPVVTRNGSATGNHTYCYVVDTADPLEGISAPSPQACMGGEPTLSLNGAWNSLNVTNSNVGPTPSFVWYVSEDSGPWQLVTISGFTAAGMDVGQRPGTRGGWPNNLPAGNPDIAKNQDFFTTIATINGNAITTVDALPATASSAVAMHDDTKAVETAILAADAAGGGTVQLGAGTYRIELPYFMLAGTQDSYPVYSTSLLSEYYYNAYGSLYLPSHSHGKLNVQGTGSQTVIVTPPDDGATSSLFFLGTSNRPDYVAGVLKMQDVAAGATSLTLTGGAGTLSAGDDIYLYSGSFGQSPCLDGTDTSSTGCHFSELNTVASVSGDTVNLVYPTSKRYYSDGGSSFGLVKTLTIPHDIAIQNLTIDTYTPVTAVGQIYGLVVNGVTIQGFVHQCAFCGGFKRDVTIENSAWGFGAGDASYNATAEYDQFTHVTFLNNTITGYGAPGAEEYSLMPRIYGTEGSSGFIFQHNTFTNASVYFDQTTGDVLTGNTFTDGILNIGNAYGTKQFLYGPNHNTAFDSFGSQAALDIEDNSFTEDAAYIPPYLMQIGNFTNATISGNSIVSQSSALMAAITLFSGQFTGNTLSLTNAIASIGIALVPDQSPTTTANAITAENNTLNLSGFSLGIYVPDPGFTDIAGVCVQGNTYRQFGLPLLLANPFSVYQSCAEKFF